ncbi:hypothetical protein GCM10008910_33050 [Faecalicatena orotica]|uniref:Alpha-L-rhamnosidase-like protein n=1 Tax=Faecalicatena orotica TaxID=1544 RepID=A0A2Y9CAK2_9FIRM|nr:glycoside hydrolase family 2 [Faecalicatena orotica]PWJ23488.1 alpha-L-rhamnosidase-like protein [Faecalicatena orotica]SSA57750.1 alpha-L-rhamnosidase [Faecalicatena orotica]
MAVQQGIEKLLSGNCENYIFPFLWMRNQSEDVLRREIEKISECGIRAVCLESRPHPDFAGPGWWHDFDIVLDEAKKRDMKIWILDDAHFPTGQANGAIPGKYPEHARKYLMMQHTDCVGPIVQATLDIPIMMQKKFTWLDFGRKVEKPLIDRQELLSVTAVRLIDGDMVGNQFIDLSTYVENGKLIWDIPDGIWRICVTFTTYDFGARNEYINYIDQESVHVLVEAIYELHYEHYANEFGKTIVGFFSDEPGFYNVDNFDMGDAIGRKNMALPWCGELQALMPSLLGENWRLKLPLLWLQTEDEMKPAEVRHCYMDAVSRMYEKNFSCQIGKWCEDHNVSYIGHVIEDNNEHSRLGCGAGHYFRAMSGQHMSGIDTIGGQIIPGNAYGARHGVAFIGDGHFYHFALAKLAASCAQTDPKKKGRAMCETFGAYGWNFGVKSMKWLTDYLLLQGVNHFVPHAFSMAEFPDADCPPHFYAGGNNPEFPYFVELMKYTNRMCELFNHGMNVPEVAVLYPGEHDWMTECMYVQEPARELMEHQIDFQIIPVDVLTEQTYYGTSVEQGKLIVNGRMMKALIIPETKILDRRLAYFICDVFEKGLSVIFVNSRPETIEELTAKDNHMLEGIGQCSVVRLDDLPEYLAEIGAGGPVLKKECRNLGYYHYRKEEYDIYFFFNTSLSEDADVDVILPESRTVIQYDAMYRRILPVRQKQEKDGLKIPINLKPYESILLIAGTGIVLELEGESSQINVLDISDKWLFAKIESKGYPDFPEFRSLDKLVPVSSFAPEFSGVMRYEKEIELKNAEKVLFCSEHIYEAAEVFVNGKSAGKRMTPPYQWDISIQSKEGKNKIAVEVVNTPARAVLKNPGLFGPDREILEPSGMFGNIMIKWY